MLQKGWCSVGNQVSVLARGGRVATTTKQRRRAAQVARGKNGSNQRVAAEFPAGSLEAELSDIGRQCLIESGQNSPPATSQTSITTSTAHRKKGEAGLCGHAVLGCSTSSTRSVPRTAHPCAAGARRSPHGFDRRGTNRTSRRPGSARSVPAGGGSAGGPQNPERPSSSIESAGHMTPAEVTRPVLVSPDKFFLIFASLRLCVRSVSFTPAATARLPGSPTGTRAGPVRGHFSATAFP